MSPPGEYVEETRLFSRAIKKNAEISVKTLLHLGCGGGHNDYTFKRYFDVTGLDISPRMLSLAKKLNPQCDYVNGDMRDPKLSRQFDSVFAGDSISHILSEKGLSRVFNGAFKSLKPGGVFLVVQEFAKGKIGHNSAECVSRTSKKMKMTYVEYRFDPDANDTKFETAFVYFLGNKGRLKVETDRGVLGIFPEATWMKLLKSAGLRVKRERFIHSSFPKGHHWPMYVCVKPKGSRDEEMV
jgi:SAM-dependent methyltransferase